MFKFQSLILIISLNSAAFYKNLKIKNLPDINSKKETEPIKTRSVSLTLIVWVYN